MHYLSYGIYRGGSVLLSFASNCFYYVVELLKYDMIGPH
jgi:hypothetical protein